MHGENNVKIEVLMECALDSTWPTAKFFYDADGLSYN
jgi:hypothetical protein